MTKWLKTDFTVTDISTVTCVKAKPFPYLSSDGYLVSVCRPNNNEETIAIYVTQDYARSIVADVYEQMLKYEKTQGSSYNRA